MAVGSNSVLILFSLLPLLGMAQQQQGEGKQPGLLESGRQGYNLFTWFSHIHVFPVEVWLRHFGTFGERYTGLAAMLSLLWLPMFGAFARDAEGFPVLMGFGGFSLFLLIVHQGRRKLLQRQGYRTHSRCKGESRCGDGNRGYHMEVMITALAGFLALGISQCLGTYLLVAAFCLAANQFATERELQAKVRALHDARIEQAQTMEEFNRLRE
jgi:hypothetical protein